MRLADFDGNMWQRERAHDQNERQAHNYLRPSEACLIPRVHAGWIVCFRNERVNGISRNQAGGTTAVSSQKFKQDRTAPVPPAVHFVSVVPLHQPFVFPLHDALLPWCSAHAWGLAGFQHQRCLDSTAQPIGLGPLQEGRPACRAGIPNPRHTFRRKRHCSAQESGGIRLEMTLSCGARVGSEYWR